MRILFLCKFYWKAYSNMAGTGSTHFLYDKGCLSLSDYFIDMSPMLMSPFFVEKTCFWREKHVFSTKNGLINVGLMSIEWLNKERQPLEVYLITWRTYSIYIFICHLNWKTCNKHLVNVNWPGAVVNFWKLTCFSQLNSCFVDDFPKLTIKVSLYQSNC